MAVALPLIGDNDDDNLLFVGSHSNCGPRSQNCPGPNQLSPTDHEGLCSFRRLPAEQLGPGSQASLAGRVGFRV